ncbi:MAG: PQQ-binding-like beta-propeller repeat protein [Saprospiraceae bacterium]|nr:PQQ-binding-like beta-propeller repeat protein [Saprospiraceae bacterium]
MKYALTLLVITFSFLFSCKRSESDPASFTYQAGKDYPNYGGNKANNRYSPLSQINLENVQNLQVAWQYMANELPDTTGGKRRRIGEIQCQPIVIDGILYGTSTELHVFALKANTGEELWKFKPDLTNPQQPSNSNRGVTYWENGSDKRILYSAGYFIYALNATDGKIITSFGQGGRVDLHTGLGEGINHEVNNLRVTATSPGIIYKNTFIIGSSLPEGGDAAPGHIRAFDVLTGQLKWVFHTIPQPGEFGYDTWPKDAYQKFGGVNNWSGMSVDDQRGVVYFGTGSPSSDYYGGDREGANLFANSIVALDAVTGVRKWHHQAIHHDLWDRDFPIPPNLTTIDFNGQKRDVVVQVGKDGYVYVLDRDSGESLFPLEERSVPTDGLPGEHPYPVQSLPSKPKSLMPQIFTEGEITNISPESHEFVKNRLKEFPPTTDQFTPPSSKGTILFGYSGGAEWGGNAIDPEGILYQNVNIAPWELWMTDKATRNKELMTLSKGNSLFIKNCAACHGADRKGNGSVVPTLIDIGKKRTADQISTLVQLGNGRMPAFPYLGEGDRKALADYLLNKEPKPSSTAREEHKMPDTIAINKTVFPYDPEYTIKVWQRFTDQNGYPAIKPPWGTFNAIDLKTGDYLWSVPIGEFPELTAKGVPQTGTETYGGPVVTASGLIFIASTRDERFRAFDKKTGKVVWEYQLPAGGFSTPISYEVDGRQYIALAVGGARGAKPGGWYMAFALK